MYHNTGILSERISVRHAGRTAADHDKNVLRIHLSTKQPQNVRKRKTNRGTIQAVLGLERRKQSCLGAHDTTMSREDRKVHQGKQSVELTFDVDAVAMLIVFGNANAPRSILRLDACHLTPTGTLLRYFKHQWHLRFWQVEVDHWRCW